MKPYAKPGGPSQVPTTHTTQQQVTATPVQPTAATAEPNTTSALAFITLAGQPPTVSLAGDVHHPMETAASKAHQVPQSVQFSVGQAIIWQIKFIINCYLNKKTIAQASVELQLVSFFYRLTTV